MSIFFISDLHLSETHPHITKLFFKFLDTTAKNAQALYILGDFFEYWVGEDVLNAHDKSVVKKLNQYRETGRVVYFMPGNRDFLIGKDFAKSIGAVLLKDPTLIYLYGKPTLLAHGDALRTQDKGYQRYRTFSRLKLVSKIFLSLPKNWRINIAKRLRKSSIQKQQHETIYGDVDEISVEKLMNKYAIKTLIHGHTHKPFVHEFLLQEQKAYRIVLGDWGEAGSYLKASASALLLETFH